MISIELLLDPDTEARVRVDWHRLEAAGLSSLGAHKSATNRPHITMLVRPALPTVTFTDAVRQLPVAVRLVRPIVFEHGDRGVLAWGIEPSIELRELHRTIHDAAPAGADAPHTAPGEWTPHITLARRLLLRDLPEALDLIGPQIDGEAVAIRRWDSIAKRVFSLELN